MADRTADRFEEAVERVELFVHTPPDDTLLQLYGLYKQAMEGDNHRAEPWRVQVREHAKWEAWEALRGMHPREAANHYADLVDKL